jgi:hypothetical protein
MRRRVDAGEGAGVDLAQSHHRADPVFMLILGGESEAVSADGRTAGAAAVFLVHHLERCKRMRRCSHVALLRQLPPTTG